MNSTLAYSYMSVNQKELRQSRLKSNYNQLKAKNVSVFWIYFQPSFDRTPVVSFQVCSCQFNGKSFENYEAFWPLGSLVLFFDRQMWDLLMGGHGASFKILETRSPTLHTHNHLSIGALDEGIIMGNFLEHPETLI